MKKHKRAGRIGDTARLKVIARASVSEGAEIFHMAFLYEQEGGFGRLAALRRAIDAAIREGKR